MRNPKERAVPVGRWRGASGKQIQLKTSNAKYPFLAKRLALSSDRSLTPGRLADLRRVFRKVSPDGLATVCNAAWLKGKVERQAVWGIFSDAALLASRR